MKKVALLYRDNNFFERWIPIIEDIFSDLGYEIQIVSFSPSANWQAIRKELSERLPELKNKLLFTDDTCKPSFARQYKWGEAKEELSHIATLDRLIVKAMIGHILEGLEIGNGIVLPDGRMNSHVLRVDDQGDYWQQHSSQYIDLFSEINESLRPRRIFISKSHIFDHAPFSHPDRSETLDIGVSGHHKLSSLYPGWSKDSARLLKKWIRKAGYDAEIKVVNVSDVSDLNGVDRPNSWLLIDRHNREAYESAREDKLDRATALGLPIGNLVLDALEEGLLELDEKETKRRIESQIQEKLKA